MTTLTSCPTCRRQLRVPDDLLGKSVRCPACGVTFTGSADPGPPPAPTESTPPQLELPGGDTVVAAPGSGNPPPSAPAPRPSRPGQGPPEAATCPYCAASIRQGAARCPACGEDLGDEDDRPWERPARIPVRRDCEPHRGNVVLALGIVSLCLLVCWPLSVVALPLGITAWVMGARDLEKMRKGLMDPSGQGLVQGGRVCGIVGTILNSLYLVGCGGYFLFIVLAEQFHM